MTNPLRISVAAAAVVVALAASATQPSAVRSAQNVVFQLVYHSDTRGYYRPCG